MNRRERRRAAKKQNRPEVQLEERGRDLFFNNLHIARRGDPGTPEAKWVPLVSGFRIADDGHEITIETPDLRYYFGHLVIAADQTDESATKHRWVRSVYRFFTWCKVGVLWPWRPARFHSV